MDYSSKIQTRTKDYMLMLCLNEAVYQLGITNSVCWYDNVLRGEDSHVLKRTLDFEVEGQRKKHMLKRTWRRQVQEGSVKVCLSQEDALCRSKWIIGISPSTTGV